MKKLFIILFVLMLVFSGCGWEVKIVDPTEEIRKTENEESKIQKGEVWKKNASEHWVSGENGGKLYSGKHEIDENDFCAVCGSRIVNEGNRTTVITFDEYQNPVRKTEYGKEGRLLNERVYEYGYDESGFYSFSKIFENGKLVFEYEFDTTEKGIKYLRKETVYNDDGTKYVVRKDENGIITTESYEEKFFTKDGQHYLTRIIEIYYETGIKNVYEFNARGEKLSSKSYNLGGKILSAYDYSYEYGENNLVEYQRTLFNGNLYMEIFFEITEENGEFRSRKKRSIVYYDDGSRMESEYDENENVRSDTIYDAQGNIIE